jgi:hexosaminidase
MANLTKRQSVMRQILLPLTFGWVSMLGTPLCAAAPFPALVPKPVKTEVKAGRFELSRQTVLVAGPGAEAEARRLADSLKMATGFALPVMVGEAHRRGIVLLLGRSLAPRLGKEGYLLSVTPRGVSIRAAEAAGLFYGGITFQQLLPPDIFSRGTVAGVSPAVPGSASSDGPRTSTPRMVWRASCACLEDYPRFAWRGLLLDVARHYLPPEFLTKLVDLLALHKLNVLQLHLTDDQGWRLEIKRHPRLMQVGSVRQESPMKGNRNAGDGVPYGPFFYTQDQMRELVAYAQARHVTILPEIEMPGHFLAALTAYPQFSCTGGPFQVRTRWGVEPDILCAGNDQAIEFALDVLGEVLEVFPGEFIHIGGDEAPKARWKNCGKCQARIKAEGLKNEEALQGWFNHRVEAFLAGKGRRLIGWDEILEGGLPPRTAVMSWRGTAGGIAAANADHDVVMSPTSHCYFDYAQGKGPDEPEAIGGLIPLATVYAFEPIPPELSADKRRHILGAQGNVWTEFIWTPKDVEYFAFPRAVALAEVAWTPAEGRDYDDFLSRLAGHLRRLDQLGVNYRPLAQRAQP